MPTISTRLATVNDIDHVAPLFDAYRQFYEQEPDLSLAANYLRERLGKNESVLLVAHDSHHIVGFCQMYPTFCSVAAQPIFVLYDLFVAASARKLGAGRALLLAAERHAAQCTCVRMDLTTAKTNVAAQSLYESLGWTRDDVYLSYSKTVGVAPSARLES